MTRTQCRTGACCNANRVRGREYSKLKKSPMLDEQHRAWRTELCGARRLLKDAKANRVAAQSAVHITQLNDIDAIVMRDCGNARSPGRVRVPLLCLEHDDLRARAVIRKSSAFLTMPGECLGC
jgi:hypothetical protein